MLTATPSLDCIQAATLNLTCYSNCKDNGGSHGDCLCQCTTYVSPQNFRTETGLGIQFIQQHSDRPVWDVSVVFPSRRFLGKIEFSSVRGWQVINVDRKPHADLIGYSSYHEAALALLNLCRKPEAKSDREIAHEVILSNGRRKLLIVVLTSTDSATEVFREIQHQIEVRSLKGFKTVDLSLLSNPF